MKNVFQQLWSKVTSATPSAMGVISSAPMKIPWLGTQRMANPNLDTGTEGRGTWRELHEALIDTKAAACLEIRCQVVSDLAWSLVAQPGTPPEAMDLVRKALDGLNLVEDFEEMAKASYFGLVPLEVRWEVRDKLFLPAELDSFEPTHLAFGPDRTPTINGAVPEPGTLILHRHGSSFRNPWGLGRGRTVPRWTRVKTAVAYATYRDYPRYAHDRIVLRYPDGSPDEEQDRYVQIANRLMDSPGLVVPDGMTTERLELDSKFDVGVKLVDAADGQIAVGILGNTLTTGEGQHGTQALGAVHEGQSDRQESADGRRIEATLNRTLIPWIVALNLGPDVVPPLFRFNRAVRSSIKDRLEAALGFKKEGLQLSTVWLRETFGIPAPQDDEDTLVTPEPAPVDSPVVKPGENFQSFVKAMGLAPAPAPAPVVLSVDGDPIDAQFRRWEDGYVQRQAAVTRLALLAVADAGSYNQALESVLGLGRDFPTSAAEWLYSSLQAGRHAGAWEADREVKTLALEDAPELDYNLTPELALRWLEGKVPLTIAQADGLKDAELRARAFWVAGVDQLATVQALQTAMAEALAKGIPFDEFKGTWLARLQGTGVNEARLRTAFDLQLQGAYMGGRMASLMGNPAVKNLTYVTAGDESVRPNHAILNRITLPKGHPFWLTHTPPLGYRCRCRIRAAAAHEVPTPSMDPRLETPPDQGFGQGAQSFNAYLDTLATQPGASWTPLEPSRPGWDWLKASRPSSALPAPAPSPQVRPLTGDLVTDPTGRVIAAPGARPEVLDALRAPAEIWLSPVEGPEGQLGLELSYLLPLGNDQVLYVPACGGVVSRAQPPQVLPSTGLEALRQGVKLK